MNTKYSPFRINDLFSVKSGDYHSIRELGPGPVPLVSCGDTDNGVVGSFDIPSERIYRNAITVAYNGSPLLAKYHPHAFGAKDDVAVLVPRHPLTEETLLYIAAVLNRQTWRYSYGRKCFRSKLENFSVTLPSISSGGPPEVDQAYIRALLPKGLPTFRPQVNHAAIEVPKLKWKLFNILELFEVTRGDFHSIARLTPGEHMTVSRTAEDNGVVGWFRRPKEAIVYPAGTITISTVTGDAFVQLDRFIATDNVILCRPKKPLAITTLLFTAFMINESKWRFSYGRQCYLAKVQKSSFYLPVDAKGGVDQSTIRFIVSQAPFWSLVSVRFPDPTSQVPQFQSALYESRLF